MTFAIHTYGARPHQIGRGGNGYNSRTRAVLATDDQVDPNGPVRVLVRAGKAITAKDRELLRKPN